MKIQQLAVVLGFLFVVIMAVVLIGQAIQHNNDPKRITCYTPDGQVYFDEIARKVRAEDGTFYMVQGEWWSQTIVSGNCVVQAVE